MSKQVSLGSFDLESDETCESCLYVKDDKVTLYWKRVNVQIQLLEVIHSHVYDPMNTHARVGFSYFITYYWWLFIIWVCVLDEVQGWNAWRVQTIQEVEKQLGKSIKIFRLDRSGEYLSLEFQGYLRDNGIVTMNQTLLDIVWSIISLAILPKSFLGLCTGNYCLCDK